MARFTATITRRHARAARCCCRTAIPARSRRWRTGATASRWIDPHPKPCYLFALVAGDLVAVQRPLHHPLRPRGGARHLGAPRRRGPLRATPCASLKTSMTWDEDVFGLEYDLDVFNIAAVSDFNMGAMENKGLNVFNTKYVLAQPETATDADYQGIESRHRARVFPQLDRQPRHLPRLVPAVAEGRADGLPRPGILRRPGQPRGEAHRATCARCARRSSARMPARWRIRCSPTSYLAIDNFYTATVYNKGAEVIRMMAHADRARRRSAAAWISISPATTTRPSRSTISSPRCRTRRRRSVALQALVPPGRHAGDHASPTRYDPATRRYTLTSAQRTPPTPGQPDKQPLVIPVAIGLLDPDGAELPLRLAAKRPRPPGRACCSRARPSRASCSTMCRRRRCPRCCATSRRR